MVKTYWDGDEARELINGVETKKAKEERIKKYRADATKKMSMANKRLRRLEKNGLTDSPAYQSAIRNGKAQFSVKGKSYNELQQEVAAMDRFINSQTSTVRGLNKVLKDMAKNTGIKYRTMKELKAKASKFFELSSKVEQYLRTVHDMASAIGYQKIWEQVNKYINDKSKQLDLSELDIDEALEKIVAGLDEYTEKVSVKDIATMEHMGWYVLKDDNE